MDQGFEKAEIEDRVVDPTVDWLREVYRRPPDVTLDRIQVLGQIDHQYGLGGHPKAFSEAFEIG